MYLGISIDTLKRYADRDQFLIENIHWHFGAHKNSPRVWDVNACLNAIRKRRSTRQPQ